MTDVSSGFVLTFWQSADLLDLRGLKKKGLVQGNAGTARAMRNPEGGTTMEMLLMGLCWTVFGLGVAAVAFGAATRSESSDSSAQRQLPNVKPVAPTRFFSDSVAAPQVIPSSRVPIEILLLQIEKHVRLEQAAAESFIETPTEAQLHSKTSSPLVN